MEQRPYIIGTALGTTLAFAVGVVAHSYLHPFDPKKEHDHPQGIYLRSTDASTATGGSGDYAFKAESGSYVIVGEEVKVELRSA